MKSRPEESPLRRWAAQQEAIADEKAPVAAAADLTICCAAFFNDMPPPRSDKPLDRMFPRVAAMYSGDGTLFEVVCFILFRIRFWSSCNARDDITTKLLPLMEERIVDTIVQLTNINDAKHLLEQRLNLYSSLIESEDSKPVMNCLENLIRHTADNRQPPQLGSEPLPIMSGGIFEGMCLRVLISGFDEELVPNCIEMCCHVAMSLR